MEVNFQEVNNMKKVKIYKSGGSVMKIMIELNANEFDMALDTGALKALSMTMKRPNEEKQEVPAQVNIPVQGNPVPPAPTPATEAPMQTPVQAPLPQNPIPVQMQIPTAPPVQVQGQPNNAAPVNAVPTTTQTYTMDQLAVAAQQLMDAGRVNELRQLLTNFGVQALTALPKEQYGAFATQLRALGAKI